jgi:ribokinase
MVCQVLFKGANYAPIPSHTIHPDTTHVVLQNEIPLSLTIECLARASSSKISTVFNPSPMPTPEELKGFPWRYLTWLIVNSGEALDLCKALDLEVPNVGASTSASVVDMGKSLLSCLSSHLSTTNVVCTLGADGVLAQFISQRPVHLPAAKLQGATRDTTGAGDCFTGYMVAGLMHLEGQTVTAADYIDVLKRAVQVGGFFFRPLIPSDCIFQAAGMCVEKRGALASVPLGADVDARLNAVS